MEGVEIAGEESAGTAAEAAEEAGGEPGKQSQLRLRLGQDEETAVRTLSVQRSRPQSSLSHLQGEGDVVEDGDDRAGIHARHLPLQVARVKSGFKFVWKSLPLPLLLL